MVQLIRSYTSVSHNFAANSYCLRKITLKPHIVPEVNMEFPGVLYPYLKFYISGLVLVTPRNRFLLEKLSDSQPVKKSPTLYGTRRFITAFTSARHLSLSWAQSVQYIPFPTAWRYIFISPSNLCLYLDEFHAWKKQTVWSLLFLAAPKSFPFHSVVVSWYEKCKCLYW